jgi:Uma2 family endonuclease
MTLTIAKWTLEEYHQMIAAGILENRHVELLRGEIVEMSPEGIPHASKRIKAGEYLSQRLGDRAQVRPAAPITLPNGSEPEPDIAIVQRLDEEYDLHHPYPENIFWVIEYSHTSLSKDLEIKTKIYAEVGILEYWVVDLKETKLIVFREPVSGDYQSRQEFTQGEIRPVAFPDLVISIDKLLR